MKLSDYSKQLKDNYKKDISIGAGPVDAFPTGIFSLDKALGGGFPKHKFSLLVGPESSSKTTIALKTAGQVHLWDWETGKFGDVTVPTPVAFIDAEATFDPKWASRHGVIEDPDTFIVIRPAHAEQVVDIVNDMILSGVVGLIIIDSLEALIPKAYADKSAEDTSSLGDRAKLLAYAYRKWTSSLIKASAANEETPWKVPAVICLNQLREKIGIMYGSNVTLPGGKAQVFYSHTIVELNTAKVVDDDQKAWGTGEFKGIVKKTKGTTPRQRFYFEMSLKDSFDEPSGYVNNAKEVFKFLKTAGHVVKAEKKGWLILGETYEKQEDFQSRLRVDMVFYKSVVDFILANGIGVTETCEEN